MKKSLIVVLQLLALSILAQAPREINYQGVARDAFGVPIGNKTMSIKFDIRQGTPPTTVFTETQTIVTNSLGLFTTQIGKNSNLTPVNLENGTLQLRVSLDTTGGSSFVDLGWQKLSSVPFALHARSVPTTYTNNILTIGTKTHDLSQPVTFSNNILRVGAPSNSVVIASQSLAMLSPNTLSITNGNSVTITPILSLTGNVLSVGLTSNSVNLSAFATNINTTGNITSTVSGNSFSLNVPPTVISQAGVAQVSGGPTNYTVNVAPTTMNVSQNSGPLSFNTLGTNNFLLNVPPLSYTAGTGALGSGTNVVNITPALALNVTSLSVGPLTNIIDLATISPWKKTANTVTLATNTDLVGIGITAPIAKLDVLQSGATSAINAQNTNASSTSYAGTFDGGLTTRGKNTLNTSNAFLATNSANADLLAVKNTGDVGVGTATPNINSTSGRVLTVSATTVYATATAGLELSGASLNINIPVGKLDFNSVGASVSNIARVSGHRVGGTNDGMLEFHTSNAGTLSERMRITETGLIGVNNQNPTRQFEVNGTAAVTHSALSTGYAVEFGNSTASGISGGVLRVANTGLRSIGHQGMIIDNLTTKNGGSNSIKTGLEINSTGGWGVGGGGGHINRGLLVNVSGGADANYAALFMGGNVGIGTLSPTNRLHVVENTSGAAIFGSNVNTSAGIGVHGSAINGSGGSGFMRGLYGTVAGGSQNFGVWGTSSGGATTYNIGVYGNQSGGAGAYGGYFIGDVYIIGNLTKSGGTFKIDHPQDPSNKYLIHSFVESPDMMNIYNGNITTDGNGDATVQLPSYFEAENIEFRYQLTVMGQFAQAIVSEEIANNQFKVKTDKPNVKVSWQVTGVRNDVWAKKNRVIPEVEKPAHEKGKYLHPDLYGYGREKQEGPGNESENK